MNKFQNQYQPKTVSPPGETLKETLEALDFSPLELAERLGLSLPVLKTLLTGQAPLTPEMAIKLEAILSVPAHFWNRRERAYREFLRHGSPSKLNHRGVLPSRSPLAVESLVRPYLGLPVRYNKPQMVTP